MPAQPQAKLLRVQVMAAYSNFQALQAMFAAECANLASLPIPT